MLKLPKIVLASKSPARANVLTQIGFSFDIKPSNIDETISSSNPKELVAKISSQKALTVANELLEQQDDISAVIIACDTIPPALDVLSPASGAVYKNWPKIRFYLHDRHSKIGSEENISILLNGEFILPEWDPEDNIVEAAIHQPLTKGTHTLTISVSDQSNNITRKALLFSVP